MKQRLSLLPIIIIVFFLPNCGDHSSSNTSSENHNATDSKNTIQGPVTYSWDQLEHADGIEIADRYAKTLQRKLIIIEGYLALPGSVYTSAKSIRCDLYPRFNQVKGMHANLEFKTGTGNNEMEALPKKYKMEDFKIKTDIGEIVGEGNYVKITGELADRYDDKATVYIKKIEKVPAPEYDYSTTPELTNENITTSNQKLVYINGTLEVPTLIGLISYYYPLKIKDPSFTSENAVNANVKIGMGKSQMEPLPEKFTVNDIRIHDYKGNLLPAGKKVKLIGMYVKNATSDGGSIFVETIMD